MQECLDKPSSEVANPETPPPMRVVIVYEDVDCGLRAMQLYERLTREYEREFSFQLDLWRWEILGMPAIGDLAAYAAAAADMVLMSITGRTELSPVIKSWVENWIPRKTESDGALVLLLDKPNDHSAYQASTVSYLRSAASGANVKFMVHSAQYPTLGPNSLGQQFGSKSTKSKSPLSQALAKGEAYPHWGLND